MTTFTFSFLVTEEANERYALDQHCCLTNGAVRLKDGFLVCADQGQVLQNRNEELSRYVWARQQIDLPIQKPTAGELALFVYEYVDNTYDLEVVVNGKLHTLPPDSELQGAYCWRSLHLTEGVILPGQNEVVVRSSNIAFHSWSLAIDVRSSDRGSAKSWDRGATWSTTALGFDYSLCGAYAIRWWIVAPPPEGIVTSPLLHQPLAGSLSADLDGDGLIILEGRRQNPEGSWSAWQPFPLPAGDTPFQWRARLQRSVDPPTLRSVRLVSDDHLMGERPVSDLRPVPRSSYAFVYEQADHPELHDLWHNEQLDPLLAGLTGDFARATALCSWVNAQWIHNNSYEVYTPWRAATILDWQRTHRGHGSGSVTGFCVHFAITLAQLCTVSGMRARGVALGPRSRRGMDGHFVCEVFCRDLNRWVMFDPDFDYYFSYNSQPLNVLEIHQLYQAGMATAITLIPGPSFGRNPIGDQWPIEQLLQGGYHWFGVPLHQNWLSRPDQQPVNHGAVNYAECAVVYWESEPYLQRRFPFVTQRSADLYGVEEPEDGTLT